MCYNPVVVRNERHYFVKIILSRKGFDSTSGGYPSPILTDGTMLSLPIPGDREEVFYKDLEYENLSYLDLMNQLGMKRYNQTSRVHLDPDINVSTIERQYKGWDVIFGQCDSSASHLDNNNVSVGDIFLFFGWFRKTIKTESGYKYDPNDKNGKHIIWGYMEIGEIIKIEKDKKYPEHYLKHPHFEDRSWKNNTAYIATDKLSFNKNISGAGAFKYNDELVLSLENERRGIWKLPLCFHSNNNVQMTYHTDMKRWTIKEDHCLLKCVDRGQEFILSENSDIEHWAKELILHNSAVLEKI